jgi:hypothetical protein
MIRRQRQPRGRVVQLRLIAFLVVVKPRQVHAAIRSSFASLRVENREFTRGSGHMLRHARRRAELHNRRNAAGENAPSIAASAVAACALGI